MSRSYKKNVWVCDRNPFMKNYANRRLRRKSSFDDVFADRGWYKKTSCPWDICDWKFKCPHSFEQYVIEQENSMRRWGFKVAQSRKELQREWYKAMSK